MCKVSINIVVAVNFRENDPCRIIRAHIAVTIEANILLRFRDIARKALKIEIITKILQTKALGLIFEVLKKL